MGFKKILILVMLINFLIISSVSVQANEETQSTKLKNTYLVTELQELAIKNSKSMKKLKLLSEQAGAAKNIYSNEFENIRDNTIGNNTLSGSSVEMKNMIDSQISALEKNFGFSQSTNPANLTTDQRTFFNQYGMLKMQSQILDQKITGSAAIIDGQMKILKGLGVAGSTDMLKEFKTKKEQAEYNTEDLKRVTEDSAKITKQQIVLLSIEVTKLEDLISLLEKAENQYLKMTKVERLKKEIDLGTSVDIDKIAVQTSGYGKNIRFAKENLAILKGTINDLIGKDIEAELHIKRLKVSEGVIPSTFYQTEIDKIIQQNHDLYILDREKRDLTKELDASENSGSNEQKILTNEIKKIEIEEENKKKEIKDKLKKLGANYTEKSKAYQLMKVEFNTAEKEYQWEKKKYEVALISKLMLTGSELKYLETKNKLESLGYEYHLAKTELELALEGTMLPDEYYLVKEQFSNS